MLKPLTAVALLLTTIACGQAGPANPSLGEAVEPTAERSAFRYHDTGLVSLNDYCPVRGDALNGHVEPIYVNGRPIGFC